MSAIIRRIALIVSGLLVLCGIVAVVVLLRRPAELTVTEDPAPIEAGFILKYGGIEQNCSFDAVFAGESENLSDKAGRLLF